MLRTLPIGKDQFAKVRQENAYYVDKTLMIRDFIECNDEVALITRPRRFGKTLNLTMLRDFFDITMDNRMIFDGLAIMKTAYAECINTRPVIFFTFKDCSGRTPEELRMKMLQPLLEEYAKYYELLKEKLDASKTYNELFIRAYHDLKESKVSLLGMSSLISLLIRVVSDYYGIRPVLLIDEYDQPILSSYENGFHDEIGDFFATFYGSALKGNEHLGNAMLTGIQRMAKESIFSKLNNIRVYSCMSDRYASYFGFTEDEARRLLDFYGLTLNETVKQKYDGYRIGKVHLYNPWSLLNYADLKKLDNYWVNTSTNYLVRNALNEADESFIQNFDDLIVKGEVEVGVTLETAFVELKESYTLWGLLVNAGYLTITDPEDGFFVKVAIPNDEVRTEFQKIVSQNAHIADNDLTTMFKYLERQDMENFLRVYRNIVISCTSYYDNCENAYHMLFLGMCISLKGSYRVTSNLESGYGRHDIMLEAETPGRAHIIIELKQGSDLKSLKEEALNQIKEKKYYAALHGSILLVGLAHYGKNCEMAYEIIHN